jgi:manganese oxidase
VSGPDRIGRINLKALYREYTDATFTSLRPADPSSAHLGTLGPIIRAVMGDTIEVVFKNNTGFPASIHPHGVAYGKDAEGVPYNDGTSGADQQDDSVAPGATFTYRWTVPERSGPGPNDPSSIVWLYHCHVDHHIEAGMQALFQVSPWPRMPRRNARAGGPLWWPARLI